MITSELMQRIKSAGLYPIPVEGRTTRDETPDLIFSGSLEDYFAAAKALGATVMFLSVAKLDEEDFRYDSEDNDEDSVAGSDDEPVGGSESCDLTVALPSLADFRKYIGKECCFLLTAKSQLAELTFGLPESWWSSFQEERDKAIQKVDQDREAIREKMEKQQLQEEESLLRQTRNLVDDPEFCRIPTQRGMKAYALEKFPGLKDVGGSRLTQEIQKLSDKAEARKKRR